MHPLFQEFAHRYDLHTPPGHYQHDYAFAIEEALRVAPDHCRLLDVGCGTGVFLEAAIAAGINGYGIDAAPKMIEVAQRRLGVGRVRIQRMQEISEESAYDVICALSWVIHYCESRDDLLNVLRRCHSALRDGGLLLLQVANDRGMTGAVRVDREPGPDGEPEDTHLIHRFQPAGDTEHRVTADYVYASVACGELLCDRHELRFASPALMADTLLRAGFKPISIVDADPVSSFVFARKGPSGTEGRNHD